MAEFRLHCFGESGNCYKAALMLALTGCDWEPVWVDYFSGQTREPRFRDEVSVMGEVPVLEHAGERISQSGVILDYLAQRTGRFAPRDERERREVWRWILFDNHKFTSYFATLRFMVGLQHAPESPVTDFLRTRVTTAFGIVERRLADRPFIAGDQPTIADVSMVGYLYYPEETGVDRSKFPNINAWTGRVSALPGWRPPYELMPRRGAIPAA